MHLNVNEIFGPTIQGEGINTGKRVAFLRLAGCNLACSWCDTPYSWDWERYDRKAESHKMTIKETAEALNNIGTDIVIISGGEPMLQQKAIISLQKLIPHVALEIETNGTIEPLRDMEKAIRLFVVSPKLEHAGDKKEARLKVIPLERYAQLAALSDAIFKFVVSKPDDINQIKQLQEQYQIPNFAIWLMPLGDNKQQQLDNLEWTAQQALNNNWNFSPRLHTLIWDKQRKV